jgi:hypothetical protein
MGKEKGYRLVAFSVFEIMEATKQKKATPKSSPPTFII